MRSLVLTLVCAAALHAQHPAAGAIRWDAWHGKQGVPGRAVEQALGPVEWHYRLPFFAKVVSDTEVSIDGTSQETMDREIAYASGAGLDYWAFVTYDDGDPMSLGLKRYLSSSKRGDIGFCLITELSRWGTKASHTQISRYAALTMERGYQKTADGRPLFYLGFLSEAEVEKAWGTAAELRRAVDEFRALVGNPYIVILDPNPAHGAKWKTLLGADAISAYAVSSGGSASPYSALAAYAEAFWDRCKATGSEVVPIVMSGWDRRPRVVNPVPWETYQKPGVGLDHYYRTGTPVEIAEHLRHAVDWIATNKTTAPAGLALVYAWNENDEGGWLTPTLDEGAARLDAIRRVLR